VTAVAAALVLAVGTGLLGRPGPPVAESPGIVAWAGTGRPRRLLLLAGFGAVAALSMRSGVAAPSALSAVGLVALWQVEGARARRRRDRLAAAAACEEYVMVLAAELSAGQTPADALAASSFVGAPGAASAARIAALGGDPVAALRAGAGVDGAGTLRQVAAAWQLSLTTGAPLAAVLRRASRAVRDDVRTRREVEEQLAPVRATGRVLAGLPLMGVVLGAGFGVNVPGLLVTTEWGQLCLLSAVALVWLGLFWIDRISERAGGPG